MARRHPLAGPAPALPVLKPLSLALLTALCAGAANAAETTLDTVVVTASGFEQKLTEAPASISVISKEELQKKPYVSLIDAVRDIEGVDVGETSERPARRPSACAAWVRTTR